MPEPRIIRTPADIQITAKADKQPTFKMVAYSGGTMQPPGWPPMAIDLDGLEFSASVPVLVDHVNAVAGVAGTARPRVDRGQLLADGSIVPATDAARQVVDLAKGGFQFSASVGVEPGRIENVPAGETVTVNGRSIKAERAGFIVVRSGVLREITICAVGADKNASVAIAASFGKAYAMTFEQWLQANGFDASTLTDQQRTALEASWRSQHGRAAPAELEQIQARWQASRFHYTDEHAGPYQRAQAAFVQASAGMITADQFQRTLTDELLRDRELKIIRDERPQGPAIHASRRDSGASNQDVLAAAFLKHLGHESLAAKEYPNAIQAAADLRCHHVMDLVRHGLMVAGIDVPSDRTAMIRAAFSTHTITTMLTTTGNKILLDAYKAFPSVARVVAKKLSASDFKTHTGFRLTADAKFEEIGPAGEIHHGTMGQGSYTYSVKTYGRMFGITRQDIINDDLGAFNTMPQAIGRGCAATVEEEFWKFVLANTGTFFGSGNLNYIDGATSALAVTGLGMGVKKMREFVDSNGDPLMVTPVYLVVPPALEVAADQLYTSSNLLVVPDASASDTTTQPDGNPYKGKYKPLVVPHIGNSTYSGYSETAWYLFGDPSDVAAFGLAYLNGMESPTIETEDAPFNTLGIQMRGYLDYGVCQIDAKGAIKSAGA